MADLIYSQAALDSEEVLNEISLGIRTRNTTLILETLKKVPDLGDEGTIFSVIKELVANNRTAILEEFERLSTNEHARWLTDPTFTSLFSLLCGWSENGSSLEVYCDESKPLTQLVPELQARVAAKTEDFKLPTGRKMNIFSLTKGIELKNSKVTPGLQLADIVASVSNFAISNPNSEFARQAGSFLCKGINPNSMSPYSQVFTPEQRERLGGLLVIIAKAQLKGMSPCERLRFLVEKGQHLRKAMWDVA